jgi:uncharacterized protein (TIGR00156 family)
LALFFVVVLLSAAVVYSRGGFTGPKAEASPVSVSEAKKLADEAKVVLSGNITKSLGDEKYEFRDSTGTIIIEVDNKVWRGVSVDEKAFVEIRGEIDAENNSVEIDVKGIKKL